MRAGYKRFYCCEGYELIDRNWTQVPVIPANAGIQAIFELKPQPNLDAGFHRHDELSLHLKPRDFKHPREGHQI
jgi:hypothetical protein